MALQQKAVCRLCRREGVQLFLKGSRCDSAKCAVVKRDSAPGVHGFRRRPRSEYAMRLREKQRAKRYYGVRESQFMINFRHAEKMGGDTGQNLFLLLERRLDNVVYRSGLALARFHARQLVTHGHIRVNGKRVDRPAYLVKPGDVITQWDEKSGQLLKEVLESTKDRAAPDWLEVKKDPLEVRMAALPPAEEAVTGFQPHLIVELCSR
jgi:small subunit ribosomal protein S4